MMRRVTALLLAGAMVLTTGCSANVSVDPDTGVVFVDDVPVNELLDDLDDTDGASDEAKAADEASGETKAQEEALDEAEISDAGDAAESVLELEGGVNFVLPEELRELKGVISGYSGEMGTDAGVYMTSLSYTGATQEWIDDLYEQEDPSDEDIDKYYDSTVSLAFILAINGDRGVKELVDFLNEDADEDEMGTADMLEEIKKVGACTFYLYKSEPDENYKNLEGEFLEEYKMINERLSDLIADAEYYEPVNPYEAMIGKKIEFTTKDIDGNEITSEEIFSQHEVTMVNVWATWCVWCVDELPELEELNERFGKKDCAIVGLLGDGLDEETIKQGKQLLKENGDTYLNILPWEGALSDDFPMDQGWPTSFFVDREGRIASVPVIGADVEGYEKVMENILEGGENAVKNEAATSAAVENNVNQYRVYVTDTDGALVEGATIQFCDDSTCRVENTDASGLAVFKAKEAHYTVHVLKVPAGYKKNTTEYELPDTYSDLHITLEKE